jgi:hypothetical protein
VGFVFGFTGKSPQAIALGAILIFGVAYLLAQGLADAAPRVLTRRTALYSVAAATGYFALQTFAEWLMAGTLPATPAPGPLEWALIVLAVISFGWSPSRRRCSRSGPITRPRRAARAPVQRPLYQRGVRQAPRRLVDQAHVLNAG